jgi:hypothetical protein
MTAQSTTDSRLGTDDGNIDASTAIRGAGGGAAAFVVSYVVAFVLWSVSSLPDPETVEQAFEQAIVASIADSVPAWKAAGYVLFNGHMVDVTSETLIGDGSLDLIALADGSLLVLAYLVPPVVLVVTGYVLASNANVTGTSQAAIAGALVAVGYAVLVVLLALVVPHDAGRAALSVDVTSALVFAGVVYPVVFGAIGGVVADAT